MQDISALTELPLHAKIYIYGASEGGCLLKRHIEETRKDIKIISFLDDVKTGMLDEVDIIDPARLSGEGDGSTIILLTSHHWRGMKTKLENLNITNYIKVNPSAYLTDHYFQKDEKKKYAAQLLDTENLLSNEKDVALYKEIIGIRERGEKDLDPLKSAEMKKIYFEFTDFGKIKTIIEGGVFDGEDTRGFLEALPHDGMIYGFEPLWSAQLESDHYAILEGSPRVKISPMALWNCKDQIRFIEKAANKEGSRLLQKETIQDKGDIKTVDTISIDEFVCDEKIEKVDLIKLDVEGAELDVLKGAINTIKGHRPQIAVCIYHKKEHLFQIPLFLDSILNNYSYRIGHYTRGIWDTVWYCLPNEI